MHKYYYTFIIEAQSTPFITEAQKLLLSLLLTHKNYYTLYCWCTNISTFFINNTQNPYIFKLD
jgi:hypothetical protein